MTDPTTENIAKVKDNLRRMQAFNDYVYNHGYAYIGNCFGLMTMQDDSDPGLGIGADLLESSFDVIGLAVGGEAGIIAADFMCSVVEDWRENAPVSLAETFTSMLIRYEKSSRQFDDDCATYLADPVSHWNDVFTGRAHPARWVTLLPSTFRLKVTLRSTLLQLRRYMHWIAASGGLFWWQTVTTRNG